MRAKLTKIRLNSATILPDIKNCSNNSIIMQISLNFVRWGQNDSGPLLPDGSRQFPNEKLHALFT